jgi:hypothetical protein
MGMIIYGTLSRRQLVHSDLASCPRCRAESLHDIERRYRVAVLWVPIFAYGESLVGQCGHCLIEYPVVSVDGVKLPSLPFIDRFGGVALALLFGLLVSLGGWAVSEQLDQPPTAASAAALPTGERVLARLEQELVVGQARGLDERCAKMATSARAALGQLPDFDSDELAVACAQVHPRSGRPRVVLITRTAALTVDRARLAKATHALNRSLAGMANDEHHVVWAVAIGDRYVATAQGSHRGDWRLQTDPARARVLLVQALAY